MPLFWRICLVLSIPLMLTGALLQDAHGAEDELTFPQYQWSFTGIFGGFDRASAQRGLQVYREVCQTCHGLKYLSYRHLSGLGYSNDEIKAFSSQFEVIDGPNDEGEMFTRVGIPSDSFVNPFPNEQAARLANNGAFPPDLSLILKARKDAANRVYAILTGYTDPPEGFELGDGMSYNRYFEGGQIAMPPPMVDDQIEYQDGTSASIAQMSRDVVEFLAWTAEPELEQRKSMGVKVSLFLIIFFALAYINKRRIWSRLNPH